MDVSGFAPRLEGARDETCAEEGSAEAAAVEETSARLREKPFPAPDGKPKIKAAPHTAASPARDRQALRNRFLFLRKTNTLCHNFSFRSIEYSMNPAFLPQEPPVPASGESREKAKTVAIQDRICYNGEERTSGKWWLAMNHKKLREAAIIDIDSNVLKMRISQLKKDKIVDIDRLEYPVRLGHEVFTTGKISFESLRELSSLLHGYSEILKEYAVSQCRVVATTALREAKNRSYVLDQLKIQNDMTVEVLEEDQEKTLIYSKILDSLNRISGKNSESALIAYIGAGTIGFSVYDGKQMIFSQNIPIGSLKLHDMLGNLSTLTEGFYTVVQEYLETIIGHISIPFNGGRVSNLVLAGNGVQLIAKTCGISPAEDHFELEAGRVKELFRQIRSLSQEKIAILFKIPEEEAELLYSSLAIALRLLDFTSSEKIILPKAELWDTLIRHMLVSKSANEYQEQVRVNAISCAQKIAETYNCNKAHSECIRRSACKIFDKMKGAHGLDRRKRLLLELAAILHECGYYVTVKQHLLSSFDIIKDTDIYGMTDEEMLLTAYVARYNEYDVPNYEGADLEGLSDKNKLVVSKLVAIFRLANALDKSQKQKLDDIKVRREGNRLLISARSGANLYLEKWAFRQCAPFFQEVFGCNPELSVKSDLI
jgi:exopolyphosphatase/guanosine-5'-triphosphate,3'-diphosphate pyrophosphatase